MRVYLLITNRCNLWCSMCIRGKQYESDMDYNQFIQLMSTKKYYETELVITGGEPTLHPQFIEFVKHASEHFKKVLIATNGTTNYYIDELKNINNLMFQISLDGNKDIHDSIRGTGAFQSTLETINKFENNNLNYCIASVVGNKNQKEIFGIIPLLNSFSKMKYWRVSYEMPFGNANQKNIMSTLDWNEFVDNILEKVNFRMLIKKIFYFDLYDKYLSQKEINIENRCFNCGSGKDTIYIYPNFDVYPCTCLTDFCIGNLQRNSLEEILQGKENQKFSCYKIEKEIPCHSCKYYLFCNGGCIGMSYNILGSLGKGDVRCPILRRYYEEKGILL